MISSRASRLCIIPARGGSKRFPGKNVVPFNGCPLIALSVRVAKDSGVFDRIVVTSDDPEALEIGRAEGAHVIQRSAALASDSAQVKDVCVQLIVELATSGYQPESFCVLLPTSPLRRVEDLQKSCEVMNSSALPDVVMSVCQARHPPQRALSIASDGLLTPFFGEENMIQGQRLVPLYFHDGLLLWCRTSSFVRSKSFFAGKVVPFEIPLERSVDIDYPIDLAWAEFLAKRSS